MPREEEKKSKFKCTVEVKLVRHLLCLTGFIHQSSSGLYKLLLYLHSQNFSFFNEKKKQTLLPITFF